MSELEVRGLSVSYGKVQAVQGIDLDAREGSIVAVLGSNGAGKSSTLNAISGVVRRAAGRVVFRGQDVTRWPPDRIARAGLVQVPEGRRIFAPLTVEENLLLGSYSVRSRARKQEILADVYGMFPILRERRNSVSGLLSGGEQQMLAFGRALMADPRMLLLDEPSMGLAPVIVNQVMDRVVTISKRGVSILMVEQNAAAALEIASYAYVLEQGRVVLEGEASKVADNPLVLRAFLGIESDEEATNHTGDIAGATSGFTERQVS